MDRYDLDWKQGSKSWKVVYKKSAAVLDINDNDIIKFAGTRGAGTIAVAGTPDRPYGKSCIHHPESDIVQGKLLNDTIITITRTVYFRCDVGANIWRAVEIGYDDLYERDWMLMRDWFVITSDVANVAERGNVVFKKAGDGTGEIWSGGVLWGDRCTHDANSDVVSGKLKGTSTVFTITRRVGLTCKIGASGANSWIAVEGG